MTQALQAILDFLAQYPGICFGTHKKPHGDELCAFAIGRRFDSEHREAKVFTFGSKKLALEAEERAGGKLTLVGIGRGEYDEHGESKKKKKCAANLVAERLKLDPAVYGKLLDEVKGCDLNAESRGTQVSELVKVLYTHYPDEQDIIEWGVRAYDALLTACELGNLSPKITGVIDDIAVATRDLFIDEVKAKHEVVARAWDDCIASANDCRGLLTDFQTIAEIIALQEGVAAAKDWARIALYGIFVRQVWFDYAVEAINTDGRSFKTEMPTGAGPKLIRGVSVSGDSEQFIRAFRSKGAKYLDLLVIRNPMNGNVGIFPNSFSKIPMREVFKAIQFAEARKRSIYDVSYDELGGDEEDDRIPQWYLFAEAGHIMNGSRSYPDVENTALTIDEIIEVVSRALERDGLMEMLYAIKPDPRFEKVPAKPLPKGKRPQGKVDRRQIRPKTEATRMVSVGDVLSQALA